MLPTHVTPQNRLPILIGASNQLIPPLRQEEVPVRAEESVT